MELLFLQSKNKSSGKRFGKKGWSLRRGKRTFPQKVFSTFSSPGFYCKDSKTKFGGVPDSIGSVRGGLHVEDDRWPRKTSIKTIIANEQYALAA